MTNAARAALLALGASLAMAASAAAYTATISPAGSFSLESNGRVTYSSESISVACDTTLTGTLASRIANVESEGEPVGSISAVRYANCSGGTATATLSLPRELEIFFLLGTLPDELTGFLWTYPVDAIEFSLFGGAFTCLYVGSSGLLFEVRLTERGYVLGQGIFLFGIRYAFVRGSALCPRFLLARGEFDSQPAQTITVS
jgi:hypothetical protein